MLSELHVVDLGIVADLDLVLGPGLTAITGETGAGKTLLVEGLALLLGGRADASIVRHGASEARVEGRFLRGDGEEVVLARVVPTDGRSRAYIDGRLAELPRIVDAVVAAVADRPVRAPDPAARPPLSEPARDADLVGRHIVVTAGGTAEPIDPVRFIGNRSTGKMGVAIAEAALDRGARVTLIAGSVTAPLPAAAHVVRAESTAQMRAALRPAGSPPSREAAATIAAAESRLGSQLRRSSARAAGFPSHSISPR